MTVTTHQVHSSSGPHAGPIRGTAPAPGRPPGGAAAGPAGRIPIQAAGLPRRSRDDLLVTARRGLAEAEYARPAGERYSRAHLAALRAAAAVLADRAQPRPGRRGRPLSAWCLLIRVAPELVEWAEFFAAGAARRAAAEAGLNVVSHREADDLVRQVGLFIGVVEGALGLPSQPVLLGAGPVGAGPAVPAAPRRG